MLGARKKAPYIRGLDALAETKGFEPLRQVLPVCSLSRGVPSTSRPRLHQEGAIIASSRLPVKRDESI